MIIVVVVVVTVIVVQKYLRFACSTHIVVDVIDSVMIMVMMIVVVVVVVMVLEVYLRSACFPIIIVFDVIDRVPGVLKPTCSVLAIFGRWVGG